MVPVEAHSGRCTRAPVCGQRLPAVVRLDLEVALVGELGVGDGRLSAQRRSLGQDRIDRRVHPRDEEAGHGVHVIDRLPLLHPSLQPADEGPVDGLVVGQREQQRHVDVDAGGNRLLDGGHALGRPRDLDEDVGPVDPPPELRRRPGRRGRVVGHRRRQLERDEAVQVAGGVVHVAQLIGRAPGRRRSPARRRRRRATCRAPRRPRAPRRSRRSRRSPSGRWSGSR